MLVSRPKRSVLRMPVFSSRSACSNPGRNLSKSAHGVRSAISPAARFAVLERTWRSMVMSSWSAESSATPNSASKLSSSMPAAGAAPDNRPWLSTSASKVLTSHNLHKSSTHPPYHGPKQGAMVIQFSRQGARFGQLEYLRQTHGIRALKDVAPLPMHRSAAMRLMESENVLKARDDAFLARGSAGGFGRGDFYP